MPAPKGKCMNPEGRPKGSKNKKTEQWEEFSAWFLTEGMSKLEREMAILEGKDYIVTVKDLLEYFKPKLARTELAGDKDNPIQANVTVEFVSSKKS